MEGPLPTQDIFNRSSGIAHHWKPGYYFPDAGYRSKLHQKLPDNLSGQSDCLPDYRYTTSYKDAHGPKFKTEPTFKQTQYQKAPAHYYVSYNKDLREKILNRYWRRPLSPSHQKTETQEELSLHKAIEEPFNPMGYKPFNLQNHHTNGPSKEIIASTQNPKTAGNIFFPKNKEIYRQLDPYLTTTMKDHRVWKPSEWQGTAKKDMITFWDCEDYPKVRGFGVKENPIMKNSVPREPLPMRDNLIFKQQTKQHYVPPLKYTVPHSGMETTYADSYTGKMDFRNKKGATFEVDSPNVLPAPGPYTAFAAPSMYKTEYSNIGNERTVTVGMEKRPKSK